VAPEHATSIEQTTPGIMRMGTVVEQAGGERVLFRGYGLEVEGK